MLTNNSVLNNLQGSNPNITDDRPPLQKFRRLGLYIILNHNGHDIDENMGYTEMLAFANAHERSLTLDGLIIEPRDYGGFTVRKPKELTDKEKLKDKEIQDKRSQYDENDWDLLKDEASKLGLDITRMNEKEVVAAIVDAKKDMTVEGYESLPWAELKRVAKERGIETHGKKKPEILLALKGK